MARLARPGGWVACQEPDVEHALCYPPLPEWDRVRELLMLSFARSGADPRLGRRVPELLRQAGLEQVEVTVHASCYPAGHSRRTLLPDLVRSLRPVLLDQGLASDRELAALDGAVRAHLADPWVLMMPHLLVSVLARKPLAPLSSLRADHAGFRHDRRDQVGRGDVEGVVERAGSLGRGQHARE
jgi:hypothetical protein